MQKARIWRSLLQNGTWSPRVVAVDFNPDIELDKALAVEYKEDAEMYVSKGALSAVGIDLWQVKSGTIFNNIIIVELNPS